MSQGLTDNQPLILSILMMINPSWDPPRNDQREWTPCLCPFHDEEVKSAAVSFEHNAFRCFACGVKGSAITLLMKHKRLGYKDAVDYAKRFDEAGGVGVPQGTARKPRRRVFEP